MKRDSISPDESSIKLEIYISANRRSRANVFQSIPSSLNNEATIAEYSKQRTQANLFEVNKRTPNRGMDRTAEAITISLAHFPATRKSCKTCLVTRKQDKRIDFLDKIIRPPALVTTLMNH